MLINNIIFSLVLRPIFSKIPEMKIGLVFILLGTGKKLILHTNKLGTILVFCTRDPLPTFKCFFKLRQDTGHGQDTDAITVLLEYFAGEKPLQMSQISRKVDPLRSNYCKDRGIY